MPTPRSPIPILFLFDADHQGVGSYYGGVFDPAFLKALRRADTDKCTFSLVLRGDLLISDLAYKTAKLSAGPLPKGRAGHFTQSTEMRADMGLYKTLIGDLADAFGTQWNTIDAVAFPRLLGNHNLHCIFLPTLLREIAVKVDHTLRSNSYYIGAVHIDFGNPLQYRLTVKSLISDTFIQHGTLYMKNDTEGEIAGVFEGASSFCKGGLHGLDWEQFEAKRPPVPVPDLLSTRGEMSRFRMEQRLAISIYDRVANKLSSELTSDTVDQHFEWDLSKLPKAFEEVEVHARKLSEYLLNDQHPDGASKAKFFEQELGIVRADKDFLHYQLVDGLKVAALVDTHVDVHGIRFEAVLPVQGRNGAVATIKTAWIIRKNERASLVTAVPAKRSEQREKRDLPSIEILALGLVGDERWASLYFLAVKAAELAASNAVPTPMLIEGSEFEMEGLCGWATIVVPDARRGFARWLLKSENGGRHYRGGANVHANVQSQSHEIALAYAKAFARVLRRNGVECRIESALD